MTNCPVCKLYDTPREARGVWIVFACMRCGDFALSCECVDDLPFQKDFSPYKRAVLSHHIRRAQSETPPRFTNDLIQKILKDGKLPEVSEQIDSALEYIGKGSQYFGDKCSYLDSDSGLHAIAAYAGYGSLETFPFYIFSTLKEQGIIEFPGTTSGHLIKSKLTFKGWQRYEEIRKGRISNNKAFMAMEYSQPELDKIVNAHFRPAVAKTGYELVRLDDRPQAGLIDIRLRQEIKTCKFVIADLTHGNKGAYWEAGFAEGVGKPVIYTCEKSVFETLKTHFDVNHHLTIKWENDKPQEAADQLKAAIRYTFPEAKQEDSDD